MNIVSSFGNERDVEVAALDDYIWAEAPRVESLLDVGYDNNLYQHILFQAVDEDKCYGINLFPEMVTAGLLAGYFTGDVCHTDVGIYSHIICVSVIEHYGVKQYDDGIPGGVVFYKPDPTEAADVAQVRMFRRMYEIATKSLFLTFPYGKAHYWPNEYAVVDRGTLEAFCIECIGPFDAIGFRFFYRESIEDLWGEIDLYSADKVRFMENQGVRCVCLMTVGKMTPSPLIGGTA